MYDVYMYQASERGRHLRYFPPIPPVSVLTYVVGNEQNRLVKDDGACLLVFFSRANTGFHVEEGGR